MGVTRAIKQPSPQKIRLVKGSHIVVPKIHPQPQAYILQNSDKRIVFVIPYQQDYSLIGTTDVEYQGDPAAVSISAAEVDYLCKVVNQHFIQQIRPSDVVHSFSGVRPLCQDESDDPSAVTRDYTLELSPAQDGAPLLSVFGGKLTTYRKLAEAALALLAPRLDSLAAPWTEHCLLPGANLPTSLAQFITQQQAVSHLPKSLVKRWCRQYGSKAEKLLQQADAHGLGQHFGGELYQLEVDYLVQHEWAYQADDILWRRTKQGLLFNSEQQQALQDYLQQPTIVQGVSASELAASNKSQII